jgi:hypothetical protein
MDRETILVRNREEPKENRVELATWKCWATGQHAGDERERHNRSAADARDLAGEKP